MGLNAFYDSWVSIRKLDGEIVEVGLIEAFEKAAEYEEIVDDSIMNEFGVFRLIQTIAIDCFRPKRVSEIENILDSGKFEMDKLQSYIKECEKNGVSFDFYDNERPFLQHPRVKWNKEDTMPIAKLNPVFPAGNNHVHFLHKYERDVKFTKETAAKLLCSAYQFSAMGGKGYTATVYSPSSLPIFCLIKGKSLFETIVFNMVPVRGYENFDNPSVFWRNNEGLPDSVPDTSLLSGMIFPCRKIRLIESNGTVASMQYGPGTKITQYENYKDPNISYYKGKKKTIEPLCPELNKESWRDIGTIMNRFSDDAPYVVKQYDDLRDGAALSIVTYEVPVKQASYLDCRRGEMKLPAKIFNSESKCYLLNWAVENCDDICNLLKSSIGKLQKIILNGRKSNAFDGLKIIAESAYYNNAREIFWSDFIRKLETTDNLADVKKHWHECLYKLAERNFDDFVESTVKAGKILVESENVKSYMFKTYIKKHKEIE